jgi:hypothetical protein
MAHLFTSQSPAPTTSGACALTRANPIEGLGYSCTVAGIGVKTAGRSIGQNDMNKAVRERASRWGLHGVAVPTAVRVTRAIHRDGRIISLGACQYR